MREEIMSSSAKALTVAALVLGAVIAAAADGPQALTAERVKDLQAKYARERADADKEGLAKKFSPDWYARAEAFAQKGEAALTAGRLAEARDAFVRACWQLPALPPGLPAHVVRVFGDGRLRHSHWVMALA
jgi:hypothetical protein